MVSQLKQRGERDEDKAPDSRTPVRPRQNFMTSERSNPFLQSFFSQYPSIVSLFPAFPPFFPLLFTTSRYRFEVLYSFTGAS